MDDCEVEEIVSWNLSFGIPIKETLKELKRLDLLFLYNN
tara:strand:+ start:1359 stop:1475 length:117 start_codon:yes stop_codon:yes gene_type:complete